jgi:hypothetical protein
MMERDGGWEEEYEGVGKGDRVGRGRDQDARGGIEGS